MPSGLAVYAGDTFDAALSEASSFEIHERMGQPTRFAIRLPLIVRDGDAPATSDGRLAPGSTLSFRYEEEGSARVLVEGPITEHVLRFEHGGGDSYLEVRGSDVSIEMDREVKLASWEGDDGSAVSAILATHGLQPDVSSTDGHHDEIGHVLVQHDSDLGFVQRLARRNGYLFWVTHELAGPASVATGHFKRPPVDVEAPGAIVLNQEPPTALTFDLQLDVERPTSVDGLQLSLTDKSDLDATSAAAPLEPLGAESLADITTDVRSVQVAAPVDAAGELMARGTATLMEAAWFVEASTETTRVAFGAVLRAHAVVRVEGLGARHSGRYFVAGVRHLIDASSHRMQVALLRNAWGN